ncbi:MAG TPA: GyrI-like domain-containing protein [Firmicutes bacterium]|jgi:predicted transcriptional regulator YdeE|nr:MAG: hypothetical protein AA931_10860 [Peptococcaceae bacterium 1109]HHT73569.1 GyrI-like domain-containing protein [Bacillota bacterium]
MPEIIKVYRESLPAVRLVGKRYTDKDRGPQGMYAHLWGEWFEKGYFAALEPLPQLPDEMNGYLGCMRMGEEFEYWIGMFTTAEGPVPEGFDSISIPAGDIGVCWVKGREDTGELYGHEVHTECTKQIREQGWVINEQGWFFERYNCPRFTDPDGEGNVVLDYCFYLAS